MRQPVVLIWLLCSEKEELLKTPITALERGVQGLFLMVNSIPEPRSVALFVMFMRHL